MTRYLFHNVKRLDPAQDELLAARKVLVEGDLIREVSERLRQRHRDRRRRPDAHAVPGPICVYPGEPTFRDAIS